MEVNCHGVLQMATPTNHMLFLGRIYIARGPWYFGDCRNIFLPNVGKDQKRVLPSELWAPGTVPYGKSGPGPVADLENFGGGG